MVDINTLYSPQDMGNFYSLLKNINSLEEIFSFTKELGGNFFTVTKKSDVLLEKNIIIRFSYSSPHNEALLNPANNGSTISVGISVIIKSEVAYTTIFFIK